MELFFAELNYNAAINRGYIIIIIQLIYDSLLQTATITLLSIAAI